MSIFAHVIKDLSVNDSFEKMKKILLQKKMIRGLFYDLIQLAEVKDNVHTKCQKDQAFCVLFGFLCGYGERVSLASNMYFKEPLTRFNSIETRIVKDILEMMKESQEKVAVSIIKYEPCFSPFV